MILSVLTSISKIAIVAFIVTLGAIIVELYLISKKAKSQSERKNIHIPAFNEGNVKLTSVQNSEPVKLKKVKLASHERSFSPQFIATIAFVCIAVFVIILVGVNYRNSANNESDDASVVILPPGGTKPTESTKEFGALNIDESLPALTPTQNPSQTASPSVSPTKQQPTVGAGILAQAPSPTPTPYRNPVITLKPVIGKIATTTPTLKVSATPTKAISHNLPKAGGFQPNFVLIFASIALIAFALLY